MKYQFHILSFVGGFVLMTVELTASRITAPIIGASIYSWTSIIGVILLALSIGNIAGGKLADNTNNKKILSYILLACGASIAAISYLAQIISLFLINDFSLVANILIISFSLFFIPSLLLGTLFPFILKFSINDIAKVGKTSGILSGLSALGSIAGTFLTGFFFISHIGSYQTLLIVSFLLFSFGVLLLLSAKYSLKNILPLILLAAIVIPIFKNSNFANKKIIYKKESDYYNIKVVSDQLFAGGSKILFLDEGTHSIEPLDSMELLADYNRINAEIIQAEEKTDQNKKILIIGGGSYSLPKYLKIKYPVSEIEVLEIDPEVQRTAEKLFGLDSNKIKTVINDARLFFKNANKNNYDIVINDAYSATISVPWQLTTREFIKNISENLSKNGVYIANLNSSLKNSESDFLKSYYKTVKSVFSATYALKTNILVGDDTVQNEVLVSFKNPTEQQIKNFSENFDVFETALPNSENSILLTDNFAPVERLMAPSINKYHQYYLKNIYSNFLQPDSLW